MHLLKLHQKLKKVNQGEEYMHKLIVMRKLKGLQSSLKTRGVPGICQPGAKKAKSEAFSGLPMALA